MMKKYKKYLYDLELADGDTVIVRNRRTKQYGLVITKKGFEDGVGRKFYQYKDGKYFFDLKWIPNYMIEESIEMLENANS